MGTVLQTARQVLDDCKAMLTPFLPHSTQAVHELLGGKGVWSSQPRIEEVEDLDGGPAYPIITGEYGSEAVWASTRLPVPARPAP
jgi:methionyl-tRNA synthetase